MVTLATPSYFSSTVITPFTGVTEEVVSVSPPCTQEARGAAGRREARIAHRVRRARRDVDFIGYLRGAEIAHR
jgi:hypothetical protein